MIHDYYLTNGSKSAHKVWSYLDTIGVDLDLMPFTEKAVAASTNVVNGRVSVRFMEVASLPPRVR